MSVLSDSQDAREYGLTDSQEQYNRVPGPKNEEEYSPGNIVINPSNETLEGSQRIEVNAHRTPMATDRRGFGQISYYSSLEKTNVTRGQSRRDSGLNPKLVKTRSQNNAHQRSTQLRSSENDYQNAEPSYTKARNGSQPNLTAEIRASHYKEAKRYMQAPSMKYQHDLKSYKTMKSHRSQNRTQINPSFQRFDNSSSKVAANLPSMLAKPSTGTPISNLKAYDTKSSVREEKKVYTTRGIAESLSSSNNRWIKSSTRPQSKLGKSPEMRLIRNHSPQGGKGAKQSRKHLDYKKNIKKVKRSGSTAHKIGSLKFDQYDDHKTRIRKVPPSENNRPSMTHHTKQPSITRVNSHMENVPIFRLELNLDTTETSNEKPQVKAVERMNVIGYGQNPRHSLRPIAQKQIDSDEEMESERNFSPSTSEDGNIAPHSGMSHKQPGSDHISSKPIQNKYAEKSETKFNEFFEEEFHEGKLQSDTKYSEEVMVVEMNEDNTYSSKKQEGHGEEDSNSSMVENMIPGEFDRVDVLKAKEKYMQNAERVQQLRSRIIADSDDEEITKEQEYQGHLEMKNTSDFPKICEFTPVAAEQKITQSKEDSSEFSNEDLLERTRVIRSKLQAFMSKRGDGSENVHDTFVTSAQQSKTEGAIPSVIERQVNLDTQIEDSMQSQDSSLINYKGFGSHKPSLTNSSPRGTDRPSYPLKSTSPERVFKYRHQEEEPFQVTSIVNKENKLQESPCFNKIDIGEEQIVDASEDPKINFENQNEMSDTQSKSPETINIVRASFNQNDKFIGIVSDKPKQEVTIPHLQGQSDHRMTFTEQEQQCKTASPPIRTSKPEPLVEEESIEIRQLNLEQTYDDDRDSKPQIINNQHVQKRTPKMQELQDRYMNNHKKTKKAHKFGSKMFGGKKKEQENLEPRYGVKEGGKGSTEKMSNQSIEKGHTIDETQDKNPIERSATQGDSKMKEAHLQTDIDVDKTTGDYGKLKQEYDLLKKKLEQLEINKVKKAKRNTGDIFTSPSLSSSKQDQKKTVDQDRQKLLAPIISQTPEPLNTRNANQLTKVTGPADSMRTENTQESSKASQNSHSSYGNQTYFNNQINPLHFSQIAQIQQQANLSQLPQLPGPYMPPGQIGYNQSLDMGMIGPQPYLDPIQQQYPHLINSMQTNPQSNFYLGQPPQNQMGYQPHMSNSGNMMGQFPGMLSDIQLQQMNSAQNVHYSQMLPSTQKYFGQRQASEGWQQIQRMNMMNQELEMQTQSLLTLQQQQKNWNSQQFNSNPPSQQQQSQPRGRSLKPDLNREVPLQRENKSSTKKQLVSQQSPSESKKTPGQNDFDFSFKNPKFDKSSSKRQVTEGFDNTREVSQSPVQKSRSRSQSRSPIASPIDKPEHKDFITGSKQKSKTEAVEVRQVVDASAYNSATKEPQEQPTDDGQTRQETPTTSGQKGWVMNFMDDVPVKGPKRPKRMKANKQTDDTMGPMSETNPDELNIQVKVAPKTPMMQTNQTTERTTHRLVEETPTSSRRQECKSAMRLEFNSGQKIDEFKSNGKAKRLADKLAKRRAKSKPPKKEKTQQQLYEIRKAMMKQRKGKNSEKKPNEETNISSVGNSKQSSNRKGVQFNIEPQQSNEKLGRRGSIEQDNPDIIERLISGKRPKISKKEMKSRSSKHYKRLPDVIKQKEVQNHRDQFKQRKEHAKLLDKIAREQMKRKNQRRKSEAPEELF